LFLSAIFQETRGGEALGNEDFIWILLIQVFIGIMIAFFMKAGVVKAFAEMIAGKVKSPRSVKLATWFIGLFTIDDYMSPLLRGVVMRPLTDEMRVPREKLAFLLDSTCASVCTLMPFMAWGAYVAGLVADLGGPVTSNEQGVSVYISAIPFNFYAILMVLITLLSALEIFPDFGPMRKAEQRARTTGKLLRDGAVPMMGTELEELQKGNDSDVKPNVMLDFLIPIIILVATAIWTYIAKGGVKILECFIITVIYMSIELSIRKVFKSVTDLVNTAVQGMKSVMSATLILALAYCINTITKSMGAADFLLGVCESWMTPALFLSVAFIAGSVISFFTGSSWGTFAICIPIAVPMAYSFTGGPLGTLGYAAVGATSFPNAQFTADDRMPSYLLVGQADISEALPDPRANDLVKDPWTVTADSAIYNWVRGACQMNGLDFSFTPNDHNSFLSTCSEYVEAGRYYTYTWADEAQIPLVQFTRTLARERNCYPEEFRLAWDFLEHYSLSEDGTRYYSPSAFEKDDAVAIS